MFAKRNLLISESEEEKYQKYLLEKTQKKIN